MRTVLLLGAGIYHCKVVDVLQKKGWNVVVADRDLNAPAGSLADEFYCVDISDSEKVVHLAQNLKPDCIMPLNEFGMRSHAMATRSLGLLGNTLKQLRFWWTKK